MNTFLSYIPAWAWPYLEVLTLRQWWHVANVALLLFMFINARLFYYSFRRALGHEKFKGRWFRPDDLQNLKQELYSGVLAGRLPDAETMRFLDKHIYGKESKFRRMSGTDWL